MVRQRRILVEDFATNQELNDVWDAFNAGVLESRTVIRNDYKALPTDSFIAVKRGGLTITLPSARNVVLGKTIYIKDESGNAGSSNITINRDSGDTIDGATSTSITSNFGIIRLYSDKEDWFTW